MGRFTALNRDQKTIDPEMERELDSLLEIGESAIDEVERVAIRARMAGKWGTCDRALIMMGILISCILVLGKG